MRLLNNLGLITKIAIPAVLLFAVTAGLVSFAKFQLDVLAQTTQQIVDVSAARRALAVQLGSSINEATIQEKNIIIETREQEMRAFVAEFEKARNEALAIADRLIALADTPERRQNNERIKTAAQAYFAAAQKSADYGLKNEGQKAFEVSATEGRQTRQAIMTLVQERVVSNGHDLDKAKADAAELAHKASMLLMAAAAGGLILGFGCLALIAIYGVARPLGAMTTAMGQLAGGNLEVKVEGAERRDEVGVLAKALETFKANALEARRLAAEQGKENEIKMRRAQVLDELTRSFEGKVSALTQGLASAANEMEATAQSMKETASQTNDQSINVASAAEQTSSNVQTVAASTEELSISIQEITNQVSNSSRIALAAVDDARRTDELVQTLASTAEKIGGVIALINNIAGQTNLLALNATIEAARAGEAGRGFAVVATEVKDLAGQTKQATEEIGTQIAEVQTATRQAVEAIQGIGVTITRVSDISTSIAAAIEEQGAATREIARNVQEAARGTEQVTGNIADVKRGAGETGAAATQVLGAAQELARHSSELGREVEAFLAGVKAA